MASPLKYIVDDSGRRTSVLVPIKQWEELNAEYSRMQQKLAVLQGIASGLEEVSEARKGGKKLQTLKEFLK